MNYNTNKLKKLIEKGLFDEKLIINHLESAVINDYPVLQKIKNKTRSIMSGSGPTMFCLRPNGDYEFSDEVLVIENLQTISTGVELC